MVFWWLCGALAIPQADRLNTHSSEIQKGGGGGQGSVACYVQSVSGYVCPLARYMHAVYTYKIQAVLSDE